MQCVPLFPIVDGRLCCSKCRIEKPVHEFQQDSRKKRGLKAACRACELARCRDWYGRNVDRQRAEARERMAMKPAEDKRAAVAKWKASLADGYVRQRLCYGTKLKPDQLPQSLVEAKRLELSITRLVKKLESDE